MNRRLRSDMTSPFPIITKIRSVVTVMLLCSVFTACETTTTGAFVQEADETKALQDYIQLALLLR